MNNYVLTLVAVPTAVSMVVEKLASVSSVTRWLIPSKKVMAFPGQPAYKACGNMFLFNFHIPP
jgi:hypothetical protein